MAVLTKDKLADFGPFVDFLERSSEQKLRLIMSLSDTLLEIYCNVTNSYLPFDPHLGGELQEHEIRRLARELFMWSAHISHCRLDATDIAPLIDLYLPVHQVEHSVYEAAKESLRQDLVDTSAYLATNLLSVARSGTTLVIDGI